MLSIINMRKITEFIKTDGSEVKFRYVILNNETRKLMNDGAEL